MFSGPGARDFLKQPRDSISPQCRGGVAVEAAKEVGVEVYTRV
jgi:hypothetical protein